VHCSTKCGENGATENARLEKAGPSNSGCKTRDQLLRNAEATRKANRRSTYDLLHSEERTKCRLTNIQLMYTLNNPPPIDIIILSYDDCLEDNREDDQNCSVRHRNYCRAYTDITTHIRAVSYWGPLMISKVLVKGFLCVFLCVLLT